MTDGSLSEVLSLLIHSGNSLGEKKNKVVVGEGCEVGGRLLTGVQGTVPVSALNGRSLTHPPAC